MKLAVHKQKFLNLLRQSGLRVVFRQIATKDVTQMGRGKFGWGYADQTFTPLQCLRR